MKKNTKLAIVGLSATLLCASAIGANFAVNQGVNYGVNGENNAKSYTLTLNKDTSDAFKTGWNEDIFTVNTTLGNPIRFKRVTADTKGNVTAPVANTSDGLDMNFQGTKTCAYLFSLDPIQSLSSVSATFTTTNGKIKRIPAYFSTEPLTETSEELTNNYGSTMLSGGSVTANSYGGEKKYFAIKFYASSGTSSITYVLSSLTVDYTCA